MKYSATILLLIVTTIAFCQTSAIAEDKFHTASGFFVDKDYQTALATVKEGLTVEPNNQKLLTLKKILEQEQKKQQQEQQKQEKEQQQKEQQKDKSQQEQQGNQDRQQNKEQGKEDEQNKDKKEEQNKDSKKEEDGDQQEKGEKSDEEKEAKEQKQNAQNGEEQQNEEESDNEYNPSLTDKLEQMKMSPEKAAMILEAMKNQEKQYLQQLKRKPTKRRDNAKPDW